MRSSPFYKLQSSYKNHNRSCLQACSCWMTCGEMEPAYILMILLLVVVSVALVLVGWFSLSIFLIRRKYRHIPSPKIDKSVISIHDCMYLCVSHACTILPAFFLVIYQHFSSILKMKEIVLMLFLIGRSYNIGSDSIYVYQNLWHNYDFTAVGIRLMVLSLLHLSSERF